MTDEEKKAIDSITAWVDFEESTGGKLAPFRIVLNLIEKQSKEIEELKNGQIDFWISDKEIEDRIKKNLQAMTK